MMSSGNHGTAAELAVGGVWGAEGRKHSGFLFNHASDGFQQGFLVP